MFQNGSTERCGGTFCRGGIGLKKPPFCTWCALKTRSSTWNGTPCQRLGLRLDPHTHLELNDETRAKVIKRAHDLGASILELHSHLGRRQARLSPSDLAGFRDFVPHVLWRLKHLPYFAVVMTRTGFDGFVWKCGPDAPERLHGIQVGSRLLLPTKLSPFPDYGTVKLTDLVPNQRLGKSLSC